MAKRKNGNSKTAAILKYSKEHPNEGPSAISAALSSQGIDVSAQYVSTIKSKFGVAGPRKRRGRRGRKTSPAAPRTRAARSGGNDVGYDSLVKAKNFVQSVGGVQNALRILKAYADLQ